MLEEYPIVEAGGPIPSTIVRPTSFSLPKGVERYHVAGSGAIMLSLHEGDELRLVNTEGGQRCEVLAADDKGVASASLLGRKANGPATGLQDLLSSDDASMVNVRRGIAARGIDLTASEAIYLFDAASRAGDDITLTATSSCSVVIAAPAINGIMDFELQDTSTPLTTWVKRNKVNAVLKHDLPTPLADTVIDLRIPTSTAQAYFVKAGDYIQILDVDGRQCTDFQCFDARKRDKGLERALDVTTTRTLMGSSYPMPGLHGKYFDQDMTPLIEVVQDTCGRHDAFALACSAKYYDDIGYPGHINCSDNFNGAVSDHGIAPRMGWMAINFFFNTGIDEHGVLYSDEPWSRAGDYVLLRALTDIICVSSACPDDTSAANGWNPTDIHIRTYDSKEAFKRSIAYRPTPDSEALMTQETGFHSSFAQFTQNFIEYNGFWLANDMAKSGAIEEYRTCREACVVMDLSPLRKFEITGPDSEALCQYVFTRDVKKLADGAVSYTALCYPHGGMIDDGTLFRLTRDNFRWIGGSDYGGEWIREQAEKLDLNVLVRSSTSMQHNVAVQGPHSRDLLAKIIWTAPNRPRLTDLDWFRFTPARLHGPDGVPVVVSRTGYTGELGYEVFCHPKHASEVFAAIWEAGQEFGIKPMGLEALDMLRIEAGLIFAGYEFSEETDPFEAGISFTVPLKSKTDDFIGREALIKRKETPRHKFIGLEIASNIDVGHGDDIYMGRAKVGVITSAMRSPILSKNIALARIDIAYGELGTEVEVGKLDGHSKRLPAVVTAPVHYDPKKERPRS